jgi:two-component system chemotaxis response regulator CheB
VTDVSSARRDGAARDLVVIGASAGGVETLRRVVADLPGDLPATVCIVLHIAPDTPSLLAQILARAGPLPARTAGDGDRLKRGEILVAPPDRHLIVGDEHVLLSMGPRENGHRPAVDALFRSAAQAQGRRVIGVVLSGTRGDGTVGLAAVKAAGGGTIVQDPAEALYAGMPASALAHVAVDAVVPSERVAATIVAMVKGEDPPPTARQPQPEAPPSESSDPTVTVCPECGGVLSERLEAGVSLWECRVGHRYSPEGLIDAQAVGIESALWAAIRALEDRARMLDRMAAESEGRGMTRSARSFRARARGAVEQAHTVREALSRAAEINLIKTENDEPDVLAAGGGGSA